MNRTTTGSTAERTSGREQRRSGDREPGRSDRDAGPAAALHRATGNQAVQAHADETATARRDNAGDDRTVRRRAVDPRTDDDRSAHRTDGREQSAAQTAGGAGATGTAGATGASAGRTSPAALRARRGRDGVEVVDVRSADAFRAGHVPGATNVPASAVGERAEQFRGADEVVAYCQSGNRSQRAAGILRSTVGATTRVTDLAGGLRAWRSAAGSVRSVPDGETGVGADGRGHGGCSTCGDGRERDAVERARRGRQTGTLQASLTVSQPGDPAEREAERVAEAVVQSPVPGATSGGPVAEERETCSECGVGRSTDRTGDRSGRGPGPPRVQIARTSRAADTTVSDDVETQLRSVSSGGRPLSASVRADFESRFGRDFSDVRVHTGQRADAAARSLDAEAFTLGTDIAFARGNYRPATAEGQRLLAHELTHVVQQSGAAETLSRQAGGDDPQFRDCTEAVTQVRDPNEKLADASATAVARAGEAVSAIETYIHSEEPDESVRHNFGVNFSMPTYPQMQSILDTFREIQSILADPGSFPGPLICNTRESFACDPSGEHGASAYVFRDQAYIHVCPSAFTHERPLWNILLHEAAHVAGRKKDCYKDDNCFRALTSQESVVNADSYAGFTLDLSN